MKIGRVYGTFQSELKYTEHYLAKEFSKEGHCTTFVTSDKYLNFWKKYIKKIQKQGKYNNKYYDVIRLTSFFPLEKAIFKNWFKLYSILFKSNFDVLHPYGLGNISTLIVLFLATVKGKSSPPIIISDHSNPITQKREGILIQYYFSLMGILLKLFESKISRIITFSDVGTEFLSERFKISKKLFISIPLGYDQDTFIYKPESKNSENKFVIGFAGKIDKKKRIDFLLETLDKLDYAHNIKLIIVGITENNNYCDFLRTLGNKSKAIVEFRPLVKTIELVNFYNYVDLVIYPGSISITTIEANGCGTPVIIYKSIDKLENRVKNERGLLFKTQKELINAIELYYNLHISSNIPNRSIHENTKTNYSWTVIKDNYLNMYKETLIK